MSPSLSESLNNASKEKIAGQLIQQKHILKCYISVIKTPKNKFFVVLNPCPQVFRLGVLLINSQINLEVNRYPDLVKLQYKLTKEKYEFLHHDSYLDCSKIIELDHAFVHSEFTNSTEVYKGELTKHDTVAIFDLIKKSKTHPQKILKRYQLDTL